MDGQIHVWLDEISTTRHAGRYARWLSSAERNRMCRLRLERDRRSFLVAHGLARAALSWCHPPVPAGAWEFTRGPHGRPEIAGPPARLGLRFNLSHTARRAAVVVTREVDCGIDVESADRAVDLSRLARAVLAPGELADLRSVPAPARSELFFRYWTLKEAYLKARGTGLTVRPDGVSFDLRHRPIRVAIAPDLADTAADWQFELWPAGHRDPAALAIRRGAAPDLRVVHHHGCPDPAVPAG